MRHSAGSVLTRPHDDFFVYLDTAAEQAGSAGFCGLGIALLYKVHDHGTDGQRVEGTLGWAGLGCIAIARSEGGERFSCSVGGRTLAGGHTGA